MMHRVYGGITDNLLGYIITEQDKGKLKYKKLKEKKNKKKFMTKQQLKIHKR